MKSIAMNNKLKLLSVSNGALSVFSLVFLIGMLLARGGHAQENGMDERRQASDATVEEINKSAARQSEVRKEVEVKVGKGPELPRINQSAPIKDMAGEGRKVVSRYWLDDSGQVYEPIKCGKKWVIREICVGAPSISAVNALLHAQFSVGADYRDKISTNEDVVINSSGRLDDTKMSESITLSIHNNAVRKIMVEMHPEIEDEDSKKEYFHFIEKKFGVRKKIERNEAPEAVKNYFRSFKGNLYLIEDENNKIYLGDFIYLVF